MAYTKPTLTNLISAIKADMFSRFPSLDPTLANSFAENIAEVIAAGVSGNYGYLNWIAKQPFPDTADTENATRWGVFFDTARRAAAKAEGTAIFTGTIGSSVTTGEQLTASNGELYEVATGFTLTATSEDHTVQAVDAGEDGNIGAAAELTFVSVPSGIGEIATVDGSGLTGGLDIETDASLITRILEKMASPPKGGKAGDYIAWAKEATDVTRAFIFTNQDAGLETVAVGEVLLYFAMDDDYTDDGSDLVTNGDFAAGTDWTEGTGWAIGSGVATHTAGSAGELEQSIAALQQGRAYLLTYTVSGRTAGTLTPNVGSTGVGTAVSADGTYEELIVCLTDDDLIFEADSTFDGSIDDVSLIYSGLGNIGLPASGDVTDVQDYIDDRRPVGASFTAAAPSAHPIDFSLSITPDTPANQTAVETELAEMIRTAGGVGTSIKLYDIYEALSLVPNLTDWTLTTPAAAVTTAAGHLHTMGTVTFS